jgi:outer membrane protein
MNTYASSAVIAAALVCSISSQALAKAGDERWIAYSQTAMAITGDAPPQPTSRTTNEIALSAAEMFRLAEEAQQRGDLATAETVYRALTADNSLDLRNEARFRLAAIYASQRHYAQSVPLLRQILVEQPSAQRVRLELARILALSGDLDDARRELRVAQAGGLPPDVAQLVDRFSAVLRSEKRSGGSVNLAFTIDSNIDRATRSDTLTTVIGDFVLDRNAKARSGEGIAFEGQIYHRVDMDSHVTLLGSLSGLGDYYFGDSQFDDEALLAKAGPELRLLRSRVSVSGAIGRRWFGGQLFTSSLGAAIDLTRPLSSDTQLRVSATADRVINHENALETGDEFVATTTVEKALSARAGAGIALSGGRRALRDPGYSSTNAQATAFGYREFSKTTLAASVSVGRLVADKRLLLFPERRSEWLVRGIFGATLGHLTVHGFQPTARLTYERNRSTIEVYDYSRMAVDFGLTRTF